MNLHRLRLVGDPVLRTPTAMVTAFDPRLRDLVARMFALMRAADGVGLAANQIGVGLRVFVYDLRDGIAGHVVNPTLRIPDDSPWEEALEGCLSVPGRHHPTRRASYAVVEGFDEDGTPTRVEGDGLLARCLQHEVDHLDGLLYLERLDPDTRRQALQHAPGLTS